MTHAQWFAWLMVLFFAFLGVSELISRILGAIEAWSRRTKTRRWLKKVAAEDREALRGYYY